MMSIREIKRLVNSGLQPLNKLLGKNTDTVTSNTLQGKLKNIATKIDAVSVDIAQAVGRKAYVIDDENVLFEKSFTHETENIDYSLLKNRLFKTFVFYPKHTGTLRVHWDFETTCFYVGDSRDGVNVAFEFFVVNLRDFLYTGLYNNTKDTSGGEHLKGLYQNNDVTLAGDSSNYLNFYSVNYNNTMYWLNTFWGSAPEGLVEELELQSTNGSITNNDFYNFTWGGYPLLQMNYRPFGYYPRRTLNGSMFKDAPYTVSKDFDGFVVEGYPLIGFLTVGAGIFAYPSNPRYTFTDSIKIYGKEVAL